MKFKAGKLCFVLGFVLALADLSVGQTIISSIVGQVTDTTGAAIPNAQIVITNQGTGISVEAATDSTGSYSVPNLYAGVYTVQAKKEGFETVRFPDIRSFGGAERSSGRRAESRLDSATDHGEWWGSIGAHGQHQRRGRALHPPAHRITNGDPIG